MLKATHKILKTVCLSDESLNSTSPKIAGQAFEHWKNEAAHELGCSVEDLEFEKI